MPTLVNYYTFNASIVINGSTITKSYQLTSHPDLTDEDVANRLKSYIFATQEGATSVSVSQQTKNVNILFFA